jgi:hypothetical protein
MAVASEAFLWVIIDAGVVVSAASPTDCVCELNSYSEGFNSTISRVIVMRANVAEVLFQPSLGSNCNCGKSNHD